MKILIVEDVPALSAAIATRLKKRGIDSAITSRGTEALEMLKSSDDFDLVWLDFNILDFDGLEFMKRYIQTSQKSQIPVIIVSNTGDDEKIKQAVELGVKKYIIKAEARLDDTIDGVLKVITK